jgi:hypothetical protein
VEVGAKVGNLFASSLSLGFKNLGRYLEGPLTKGFPSICMSKLIVDLVVVHRVTGDDLSNRGYNRE